MERQGRALRVLGCALVTLLAAARGRARGRLALGGRKAGVLRRGLALPEGRQPRGGDAGLRRRRLAQARPAPRLGDRGPVRPRDQPPPGRASLLRGGLVPQALRPARVGEGPVLLSGDRRRDVERDRLPERPRAGRPALRLHRLRARPHAPPRLRRARTSSPSVSRPSRSPRAGTPVRASTATSGSTPPGRCTWSAGART